jgi:hypothetical protein
MELKQYLRQLDPSARPLFAKRCGTTYAYLKQVANRKKPCSETLAMNIDMESGGLVPVETMRPDLIKQWAWIRRARHEHGSQQAA